MIKTRFRGVSAMAGLICMFVAANGVMAQTGQELKGHGEWQSSAGGEFISGTWSIALSRSDDMVSGTMQVTGSNVLKSGSVTGTIDGQNVVLGVGSDGVTAANFSGRLDGDAISGEWDCPTLKDEGVWKGTLSLVK